MFSSYTLGMSRHLPYTHHADKKHGQADESQIPVFYPSNDLFQHTFQKQLGYRVNQFVNPRKIVNTQISRQVPGLIKEKEYGLGTINKIFASEWLSDRSVAFGTKCNKIVVMDLLSKQMAQIPSLKSSDESIPADCPCGIHSIAVNPSRTMLATGGENTNDLAIYKLPTFDPVCIGEHGHSDWIFDIKWLDDEFVVTGSRDSHLALWMVKDEADETTSRMKSLQVPEYAVMKPKCIKQCRRAEKVRALAFNNNTHELAALSLNACVHVWDCQTFTQKHTRRLTYSRENVCMSVSPEHHLYAIGSQSYVTFLDTRTMKNTKVCMSQQGGCGIRSVSFNDDIVTIGTGAGTMFFYDLRAGKHLQMNCGHAHSLTVGKGWLLHDDTYLNYFIDQEQPNAIYTHCYDESGTKLFAAGGPLPAGLWGNYAGLWQ